MGKKSDNRNILESQNLIKLLKHLTLNQIANKYNVSVMMVSEVASKQFRKIEVERFEENDFVLQLNGIGGAWMDSEERKFLKTTRYEKN